MINSTLKAKSSASGCIVVSAICLHLTSLTLQKTKHFRVEEAHLHSARSVNRVSHVPVASFHPNILHILNEFPECTFSIHLCK